MTAEEKDQEWRDAIACYGYDITGTPEEVLTKMAHEWQKANWRWREEITKYLPQLSVMSFCGPQSTIKWLMDRVELKSEDKKLADQLLAIQASIMSEDDKSEATLRSIFPNLGPRKKMKVMIDGIEIDIPRRISAETLVTEYAKKSLTGVRSVRHYFVDGERQRMWPIGWNEVIDSIEDGDRFEIEMGELIPPTD